MPTDSGRLGEKPAGPAAKKSAFSVPAETKRRAKRKTERRALSCALRSGTPVPPTWNCEELNAGTELRPPARSAAVACTESVRTPSPVPKLHPSAESDTLGTPSRQSPCHSPPPAPAPQKAAIWMGAPPSDWLLGVASGAAPSFPPAPRKCRWLGSSSRTWMLDSPYPHLPGDAPAASRVLLKRGAWSALNRTGGRGGGRGRSGHLVEVGVKRKAR